MAYITFEASGKAREAKTSSDPRYGPLTLKQPSTGETAAYSVKMSVKAGDEDFPSEFYKGLADIQQGRVMDLDEALDELEETGDESEV